MKFNDYQCPPCRLTYEQYKPVFAKYEAQYPGQVKFVTKDFPLEAECNPAAPGGRHFAACEAAVAVRLARAKGKATAMEEWIFANQPQLTPDLIREGVKSIAGVTDFDAQYAKTLELVRADAMLGQSLQVTGTPTFFINGRRYDGAWDESSFADAMLGTLGYKVRVAALSFAAWAPSTGILLLVATLLAVVISNSPFASSFEALWRTPFQLAFGNAAFELTLREWIDDALLSVFFLVVGLEIKRELTVGHLASRASAALPIAAAIGGMALPALLYVLVVPSGPWTHGWAVPMSTDTAFAIALIAMLGHRVPVELRIFLTAAAIVDDIGAILVVALFYAEGVELRWLVAAALFTVLLVMLNRSGVYRVFPYFAVGIALWASVHAAGLHATLAGVILAACIPARPPADYATLARQADAILADEARRQEEQLRHGPSEPALRALDAINDRLMSPNERLLRTVFPQSSFIVLPIFALANAGVEMTSEVLAGHGALILAISLGLVVGKPLGFLAAAALAVRLGVAEKPEGYSWRQLAGAGALAGIGFTMALFIAGQAYALETEFAAAKIAVFAASSVSAAIGIALLWKLEAAEPVELGLDSAPSTRSS
ncbi:MAG: Na+/H+ antiporter NhaA [Gammaproteobacteria bacterium]